MMIRLFDYEHVEHDVAGRLNLVHPKTVITS